MQTHFDEEAADHVCEFLESYLIVPETGQAFEVFEWLRPHLRHIYGTMTAEDMRQVRTFYLEVPKKNSKSTISAALALYALCADGERSGEVYSVAADTKQGGIIFEAAKKMVEASPQLRKIIKPYRASLVHKASGSVFRVLSSDATSKEGFKASYIGFDEIHIQPDRVMWDTLRGSGLARRQPLTVVTTTAGGTKDGIGWEIHDYAVRVRDGKISDPSFYPVIYAADPTTDDLDDPETHRKANPSYGITFRHEDFEAMYKEAKAAGPARWQSFCRYHLNIWSSAAAAWLPAAAWAECGRDKIDAKAYIGQTAFASLDVSSTTDLTAVSLLFKRQDGEGYDALVYQWMPQGNVLAAEQRDQKPYREWASQGYLELTEGTAIDYEVIRRRINELNKLYPFHDRQIGCDEYNAWGLMQQLTTDGLEPVPISQKAKGLSAPSKEFHKLVCNGDFRHGGNPLLDWQGQIVEIREDEDGNIKPTKGKGGNRKRIDGIVCAIMSLSQAMLANPSENDSTSIYEQRGVIVL